MPYKQKIAVVEEAIAALRGAIEKLRGAKPRGEESAALEKMLGELARLSAERTRLMLHQITFEKNSN